MSYSIRREIQPNDVDDAVTVETAFHHDPKVKVYLGVARDTGIYDVWLTRKQARQIQDAISAVLSEENV